jgi:hypothetical protein
MGIRPPTPSGLVIGAVVVLIVTAGTATAAALITGADIKNNTVASKDLKNNNVASKDLKDGSVSSADLKNNNIASGDIKDATVSSADLKNNSVASADIADGTIGTQDISAAAIDSLKTTYSGPNWSIVDRNVIGNGDSYLRAGPNPPDPPDGIGSLGIRTGSGEDAAAFGNQVDFFGDPVNDLTSVGFSVFTTGENNGEAPNNMPAIKIEIVPNVDTVPATFSTMVYVPDNSAPGLWTDIDAVADPDPRWGLTGGAFAGTECDINGARCTFEQLLDYLDDGAPDATILTVQVGKGRDFAFSGAVDSLIINDQKFDFEPFGVITTTP